MGFNQLEISMERKANEYRQKSGTGAHIFSGKTGSDQEVAVYGVSDAVKGEAVHAAVVLKKGINPTAEEIIGFCRDNMAVYRIARKVEFVKELPKSPTGKILKRVLRGDR